MNNRERVIKRLLRDKWTIGAAVCLLLILVLVLLAPSIAPHDPNDTVGRTKQRPSAQFLLGTDELGRDTLTRVLYGGRLSLVIGFSAVTVGIVGGVSLGLLAGMSRRLENGIMRVVDVLLSLPAILLAIAIVATLGPGLSSVIIAVGISRIPIFARLTRSLVIGIRDSEYVLAATALGATQLRIVWRYVLPNILSPIIVYSTLNFGASLLLGAILGFLGMGVQPPAAEWGSMAAAGRMFIRDAPHVSTIPSLVIFFTILSLNLVGDGLRDALDPKTRN